MTLDTVIIAFGAFVAVLPFLQLPQDWTYFFAFVAGVAIVAFGIVVRRRGSGNPYSENVVLSENDEEESLEA